MIVDAIQAAEKLQSAFSRIKAHTDELKAYDAEYCNLIDIKTDLEKVELYLEDMKMGHLMDEAMGIEKQTCLRCGYVWYPKSEQLPKTCPNRKCKSPYWMKPRQVKGSNNV